MSFLIPSELKTVATPDIINIITSNDDTIVVQIINESIDLIKSYLHHQYDTTVLFNQTDATRSLIVLKYLKDIVIHEIYIRRTKEINDVAKMRYDEAMLWLEKVAKGDIIPDLPKIDSDADGTPDASTFLKLGSHQPYKNHW